MEGLTLCRNHSHLAIRWVEQGTGQAEQVVSICSAQPLTLDYPDGRKVTLRDGVVLSLPYSLLVDSLLSVRLPNRVPLDSMSPVEMIGYASTDMEKQNSTNELTK